MGNTEKTPKFKEYGGGKGSIQATYDMWGLEYARLDDILKATATVFLQVRREPELLLQLYECLNEIYVIIRPLLNSKQRSDKDEELSVIKNDLFKEYNRVQSFVGYGANVRMKEKVLEDATAFRNMLMDIRQLKGLGIKVNREISDNTRMKRAVRGGG